MKRKQDYRITYVDEVTGYHFQRLKDESVIFLNSYIYDYLEFMS